MKEAALKSSASEDECSPVGEDLRTFIIYDEYGSAVRAKVALEAAVLPEGGIPLGNFKYWRCDLLEDAFLREQAAIEAAAADVIILSLGADQELPEAVEAWARRWMEHKEERRYALGALLEGELSKRGSQKRLGVAVERLAAESGADFLWGTTRPGSGLTAAQKDNSGSNGVGRSGPNGKRRRKIAD